MVTAIVESILCIVVLDYHEVHLWSSASLTTNGASDRTVLTPSPKHRPMTASYAYC